MSFTKVSHHLYDSTLLILRAVWSDRINILDYALIKLPCPEDAHISILNVGFASLLKTHAWAIEEPSQCTFLLPYSGFWLVWIIVCFRCWTRVQKREEEVLLLDFNMRVHLKDVPFVLVVTLPIFAAWRGYGLFGNVVLLLLWFLLRQAIVFHNLNR